MIEGTFPDIPMISGNDTNNILYAIYKATIANQAPVSKNEKKIIFILTNEGGLLKFEFYRLDFTGISLDEIKDNFAPRVAIDEKITLKLNTLKCQQLYQSSYTTILDNSIISGGTNVVNIADITIQDINERNEIIIEFLPYINKLGFAITFAAIV